MSKIESIVEKWEEYSFSKRSVNGSDMVIKDTNYVYYVRLMGSWNVTINDYFHNYIEVDMTDYMVDKILSVKINGNDINRNDYYYRINDKKLLYDGYDVKHSNYNYGFKATILIKLTSRSLGRDLKLEQLGIK